MSTRHRFSLWMPIVIFMAASGIFESLWSKQEVSEGQILKYATVQALQLLPSPILKTVQAYRGFEDEITAYSTAFQSFEGRWFCIMLSADRSRSPIIRYSYGPDPEMEAIDELERLVKRRLGNPRHRSAFYLGFGEIWHLFANGNDSVYVNRRPPPQILEPAEFAAHKQLLLSAQPKQMYEQSNQQQIQTQWDRLINGTLIDRSGEHYIPMKDKVPNFDWHYGCTPTAAADVLGYYDNAYGYSNLIHYYYGEDDNLEGEYDETVPDLLKILKEKFGTNDNGMTFDVSMGKHMSQAAENQDGNYDWDEYGLYAWIGDPTWNKLKDEIDDGYPAVLSADMPGNIGGHSMALMGYGEDPNKVYVYDTWNDTPQWYYKSELVFWNLAWIHPPLAQTNKGLKLTSLTGDDVIKAEAKSLITWDCDQPNFGKISIYINTHSGNGNWEVLVDLNGNPGQWEWLVPAEYIGGDNRIRIRWWDNAGNCIAEDASSTDFSVVEHTLPELTSSMSVDQNWPDGATCVAQSNQWGVVAIGRESATTDTIILELHPDTTFSNPIAQDTLHKGKSWGMCAVNLGPPNPPPGPFGIQVRGRGEGRLQYVESQTLGWGQSEEILEYWSEIDIVKAFDIYIDPSLNQFMTNSYVKLENLTSGDFVLALFDTHRRFNGYGDAVQTADVGISGGDETLLLDGFDSGRFLVVVWQKGTKFGWFRISLINESALDFTEFPLNEPDTIIYSPVLAPLPGSPSPWCVVGIAPLGGSKWKIEAAPRRDFRENAVSSALGYPFMNLLAIKRPTKIKDSLFLRLSRLTRSGSVRIEIFDMRQEPPLTDGDNPPRAWPAGQCFHILPIESSKPLKKLSVNVEADNEVSIGCGIAPIGEQPVYSTSMLWGGSFAEPEGNPDVRKGVVVLWTPEPPEQPFSYRFRAKIRTSVEEHPGSLKNTVFSIHPNPFRDQLVIQFEKEVPSESQVEMFDVMGRRIAVPLAKDSSLFPGEMVLGTRELPAGVYFIRVAGSTLKPVHIVKLH